jgi:tetratricopeptide (TPR) repeat protein
VVVLQESIELTRHPTVDAASREFSVEQDSTFIAIVEEDDLDVHVRLERCSARENGSCSIEVESRLEGIGIEVATLEAKAGDRLVLTLESSHQFEKPGRARTTLRRYDAKDLDPSTRDRIEAMHRWSNAIRFDATAEETRKVGLPGMDAAIRHLDSAQGDPHLAAWARLTRAQVRYSFFLGFGASEQDAHRAAVAFERMGERRNSARARYLQGQLLLEAAKSNATARSPHESARKGEQIFRQLMEEPASSPFERATAVMMLATHAYENEDLLAAQAYVVEARDLFRSLGNRTQALVMTANLGIIAAERGELREAVALFDSLVDRVDEIHLPETRALLLSHAAYADLYFGNTDRAIERFLAMLEIARTLKMAQIDARALMGLAHSYWRRGDMVQAKALIEESLRKRRQVSDGMGLMHTLQIGGDIARDAGDVQRASALHQEALELAATPKIRFRLLTKLGTDYFAAAEYEKAIECFRTALAYPRSVTSDFRRYDTELAMANALMSRRNRLTADVEEAEALTSKVLRGAISSSDITLEQAARTTLAGVHLSRKQFRAAREEFERAIALLLQYRASSGSPEQRATSLGLTQNTFRDYVDLMMRDVAARPAGIFREASAAEVAALRVMESIRMINPGTPAAPGSQSRIDELLAQMAGKRVRLESVLAGVGSRESELELLQFDIARLRAEVDRERARGGAGAQDGATTTFPSQPWPPLSRGTTQLSYSLGRRHGYLWVRDSKGLRATALGAPSPDIRSALEQLTKLGQDRAEGFDLALQRISGWLLPTGTVEAGTTHIEIVAEGLLARVPFAALKAAANSDARLSDTHSLIAIGSLFDADAAPPNTQRALRLMAVWFDSSKQPNAAFPNLTGTAAEVRAIAAHFPPGRPVSRVELLTGENASAMAIKTAWSQGADVVHFATHGVADLDHPLTSRLLLPKVDGAGKPTYLTAGQIQEWRGDADLVYLSACETALGPARFGDGMPGLQRAFLRAGARGVIATLWPIEDVYASRFAADFYRRYANGMPAAEALSETQRDWVTPSSDINPRDYFPRRMTAWAHVYYTR